MFARFGSSYYHRKEIVLKAHVSLSLKYLSRTERKYKKETAQDEELQPKPKKPPFLFQI